MKDTLLEGQDHSGRSKFTKSCTEFVFPSYLFHAHVQLNETTYIVKVLDSLFQAQGHSMR